MRKLIATVFVIVGLSLPTNLFALGPLDSTTEPVQKSLPQPSTATLPIVSTQPTPITVPVDPQESATINKPASSTSPIPITRPANPKEVDESKAVKEEVKIEENKISITTNGQQIEVLTPEKVLENIESYTKVGSINIESIKLNSSVYEVAATKKSKLLGLLTIDSEVMYSVNAVNGDFISEQVPWYLKYFPILFK